MLEEWENSKKISELNLTIILLFFKEIYFLDINNIKFLLFIIKFWDLGNDLSITMNLLETAKLDPVSKLFPSTNYKYVLNIRTQTVLYL